MVSFIRIYSIEPEGHLAPIGRQSSSLKQAMPRFDRWLGASPDVEGIACGFQISRAIKRHNGTFTHASPLRCVLEALLYELGAVFAFVTVGELSELLRSSSHPPTLAQRALHAASVSSAAKNCA